MIKTLFIIGIGSFIGGASRFVVSKFVDNILILQI